MTQISKFSFLAVFMLCICVLVVGFSFAVPMINSNTWNLQKETMRAESQVDDQKLLQNEGENPNQSSNFEYDFGVLEGGSHRHEFRYKNDEATVLHVKKVAVSCACLKVVQSPSEIAPGEVGVFILELGLENVFGPVSQQLTVLFEEGSSLAMRLSAFGSGFVLHPKRLNLGIVFFGSVGTGSTEILVGGIPDAAIVDFESSDERLTATLENVPPANGLTEKSAIQLGKLKIAMHNRDVKHLGVFQGTIKLRTNSIKQATLTLDVTVACAGRFEVTPETVFLGSISSGAFVERNVAIRCQETEAPAPEGVELISDHAEVTGVLLQKSYNFPNVIGNVLVRCTVKPNSKRGSIQGSLVGRSGDDVLFLIPYSGFLLEDK